MHINHYDFIFFFNLHNYLDSTLIWHLRVHRKLSRGPSIKDVGPFQGGRGSSKFDIGRHGGRGGYRNYDVGFFLHQIKRKNPKQSPKLLKKILKNPINYVYIFAIMYFTEGAFFFHTHMFSQDISIDISSILMLHWNTSYLNILLKK